MTKSIVKYITLFSLVVYGLISPIYAKLIEPSISNDGTREMASAVEAYNQFTLKSIEYTIHSRTPGFIRKRISNIRKYDPKTQTHYVQANSSRQWLQGVPSETGRELDCFINGSNRSFFKVQF